MPYTLAPTAPARRQPYQRDRRMRYDTATPTKIDIAANAGRRFSGVCAACGISWAILFRPESTPPAMNEAANTRHTPTILKAISSQRIRSSALRGSQYHEIIARERETVRHRHVRGRSG